MGKKFISSIIFLIVCCHSFAYEFDKSEYYVKENPTGSGDGSSWKNAMGAKTFAVALSTQSTIKEGVTFHLAAGTYYPEYDPYPEYHENYSDTEKEKFKVFYISKPINIIGGYSVDPTNDEKPNPLNHPTIISGDMLNNDFLTSDRYLNREDDLYNLFCIDLKEKKQCFFSGLTLRGTTARKAADDGAFRLGGHDGYSEIGAILKVDKCTIEYVSKAYSGSSKKTDEVYMSNTTFDNISGLSPYSYIDNFNSCTFSNNEYVSFGSEWLTVQNCTFFETLFSIIVFNNVQFHNNTVIVESKTGSISISDYGENDSKKISLIGNIFDCAVTSISNKDVCEVTSKYNLYKEVDDKMKKNLSTSDYVSTSINEVLKNGGSEIYLSNNYGYTQTARLTRDRLSNGKSIHFDLSETTVTTDQRGVARFDYTCIGAFEKRDTVIASVTNIIKVNESFYNKKYTKIGIYDSIPVVLPNTVGCDSVTLHKVYVVPSDNRTNFYVKTNGTGDGSSWDKAMSPMDFALRLRLSQSIDTFHVAEGVYYPPRLEGERTFKRTLPVCIIGGYPENSRTHSQKTDPVHYKTVFSVDFNNDNIYKREFSYFDNDIEDEYIVFSYLSDKKGKSLISGIVFEGGRCARTCLNAQCSVASGIDYEVGEFNIEQCEFRNATSKSIYFYDNGTLNISNCYFNQTPTPVFIGSCTVNYNGCTFADRIFCDFSAAEKQTINVYNSTIYNCDRLNAYANNASTSKIKFINNTVYSSTENLTEFNMGYNSSNFYLIGNVIQANVLTNFENPIAYSSHNVFLKQSNLNDIKSNTDILVLNFSSFLDEKISYDENVVSPVMIMTSDTLSDGTSLRFPLSETLVTTDQRNLYRLRMTTVGSYEAECQKDSLYLTVTDTINAGDIYMGKRITTEGLNYGVDTLHNIMGCDSLIFHPVYVFPENAIPTAFTPFNSNEKNDVFMQGHEVYIYDIYGSLVCHSLDGWNGLIYEEKANPGIYIYAVKMYSGEMKKGTLELLWPQ